MSYDDNEPIPESFQCFEVYYQGTREQSNDLHSYLSSTPEMRRWQAIGDMLEHGTFDAGDIVARTCLELLATERAGLQDKLHALTRLRVREMGIKV